MSNKEIEVETEDEQTFLQRQLKILQQGNARGESPQRTQNTSGNGGKVYSPMNVGSPLQNSPKKVTIQLFNCHLQTKNIK